jgi:hypothetical protein
VQPLLQWEISECTILSLVACSAVNYLSTWSYKHHDFRKKRYGAQNTCMCFDFLYKFVWNNSHSKRKWEDMHVKMYIGLHVRYLLSLSDCNESGIFSTDFRKILKYHISWNLSSGNRVVPYGRTDMTKLIVTFRSYAKAPNEMCSDIFALINLVSYVLFNLEIRQWKRRFSYTGLFIFSIINKTGMRQQYFLNSEIKLKKLRSTNLELFDAQRLTYEWN